jgi:hypothetical protein
MNDTISKLKESLKRYVAIFVKEYSKFLNREQLETLRNIDYDSIIHIDENNYPIGFVNLNQIYLNNKVDELVRTMKTMDNYGHYNTFLNNKTYTAYLKYARDNGYDSYAFYADQLIYLVFDLIVKNKSYLNKGFINLEVRNISRKYHIQLPNLYSREERIAGRILGVLERKHILNILFKNEVDAYKYLCENVGYRFAEMYADVTSLVDDNTSFLKTKDYTGFKGFINYAKDYDGIKYGDVYNYLLDFYAENDFGL